MSFIVTIDGPTSSGKTTIASMLAKELKFTNIQTGAMYRCVAYEMLRNNIGLTEEEKISNLLKEMRIDFQNQENGKQLVLLNGQDVTKEIRSEEVSTHTSKVSSISEVRKTLVDFQREISKNKNVVIEGRDTGTVVFPNADVKFFINADPKVRAQRKCEELRKNGYEADFLTIMQELYKWDYATINRKEGALKKAEDAISINTTDLSLEELKEMMIEKINNKMLEKKNKSRNENKGEEEER